MAGGVRLGLALVAGMAHSAVAETVSRPSSEVYANVGGWEVAMIRGVSADLDKCILSGRNDAGQSLWLIERFDGSSGLQLSDHSWPMRREDGVLHYMQFDIDQDDVEIALRGRLMGWSFQYDYNQGAGDRLEWLIPPGAREVRFLDSDGAGIAAFDLGTLGMATPYMTACRGDL